MPPGVPDDDFWGMDRLGNRQQVIDRWQEDHDLLVRMSTTLTRIDKQLFGNGQPGLMAQIAQAKTENDMKVAKVAAEVEALRVATAEQVSAVTPSKRVTQVGAFAGVAAFIGMVVGNALLVLQGKFGG